MSRYYNARVVRIDDITGTNWTTFGTTEAATVIPQPSPSASIRGRIYVMDTGNSRLIRMDDMNGTNWTVSTITPDPASVSCAVFDAVAVRRRWLNLRCRSGNRRIVRMDDHDWNKLDYVDTICPSSAVTSSFASPMGSVDSAGGFSLPTPAFLPPPWFA